MYTAFSSITDHNKNYRSLLSLHLFMLNILFLIDQNIAKAAKEVAKEIGGDAKSTESELLTKFLKLEESSTAANNLR